VPEKILTIEGRPSTFLCIQPNHNVTPRALVPEAREGENMCPESRRFLRLTEVQRLVPYSRSTLYLKIAKGDFPKPFSLGDRAVAWLESDVQQWIERRIEKGKP
jgi:prophage regulatory protein